MHQFMNLIDECFSDAKGWKKPTLVNNTYYFNKIKEKLYEIAKSNYDNAIAAITKLNELKNSKIAAEDIELFKKSLKNEEILLFRIKLDAKIKKQHVRRFNIYELIDFVVNSGLHLKQIFVSEPYYSIMYNKLNTKTGTQDDIKYRENAIKILEQMKQEVEQLTTSSRASTARGGKAHDHPLAVKARNAAALARAAAALATKAELLAASLTAARGNKLSLSKKA